MSSSTEPVVCADDELEAALKEAYEKYEGDDSMLYYDYRDLRNQVYERFGIDRQEHLKALGCGCDCPLWI